VITYFRIENRLILQISEVFCFFFANCASKSLIPLCLVIERILSTNKTGSIFMPCLLANHFYLHRHCRGLRRRCPAADELFQERQDRGRLSRMAQAHCHHLGDSERSRLHHGLCHAVLSGRHLESVTTRNCNEEVNAFGHFRRYCRLAGNAGDEPAGFGIYLGTRRVGLQYGHVQAVLPCCFGYV
jgi:hypothetical protein